MDVDGLWINTKQEDKNIVPDDPNMGGVVGERHLCEDMCRE
jgi:hypothetical protein